MTYLRMRILIKIFSYTKINIALDDQMTHASLKFKCNCNAYNKRKEQLN